MLFAFTPVVSAANPLEEIRDVGRANDEFYQALNAVFKGDVRPMEAVWLHAEDITYLGPDNSFVVGWDNVLADWKKQAAMKLGGHVNFSEARILFSPQMAIVQCYEVGENFDSEGKSVTVKIRATNVFRKVGPDWKMISHHTDLLPELMPAK